MTKHTTHVDYILGQTSLTKQTKPIGPTKFFPICDVCGQIGNGEDFEADARAIATRHAEVGGFG